jgi:hypothetical protein
MQGRERFDVLPSDQSIVANYIRTRARAARLPA